jgi:hypothetical protein
VGSGIEIPPTGCEWRQHFETSKRRIWFPVGIH